MKVEPGLKPDPAAGQHSTQVAAPSCSEISHPKQVPGSVKTCRRVAAKSLTQLHQHLPDSGQVADSATSSDANKKEDTRATRDPGRVTTPRPVRLLPLTEHIDDDA